ncbi:MAG TPA: hypothetical protein VJS13_09215 [Pyrinomonadaceae bacterium]|nr:hypothetical protein [Pyrinomonadaceae bacterium]
MKPVRSAFAVTILSLSLTASVLAGQISSPGAVAPPPPPGASITTTLILTLLNVIPIP